MQTSEQGFLLVLTTNFLDNAKRLKSCDKLVAHGITLCNIGHNNQDFFLVQQNNLFTLVSKR